jgi:LacI family transcriptional regulator
VSIANINQALGPVAAVRESGLRVPAQLSLVCHDDDPVCAFLGAPLSTVRMPLHELGSSAVDALIEHIEGARTRHRETAPELVPRRSTGPAPR